MIVACGPWANKLTRGLGGVVPLALSRGQAGRFRPRHAFGPPGPIISDHAQELWIKPEGSDGHYLIGGRGGRLDRSPHQRPTGQAGADDSTLETFAGELAHRFPGMAGGVWRGSWSSFYDFTPDGNPVIDQIPGPPQPDHGDRHVGALLQARAVARPRRRPSSSWTASCAASTGRSSPTGASRAAATASAAGAAPDDRRRAARRGRRLALPRGGRRRQGARAGRRAPARRVGARRARGGAARRSRDRARRAWRRGAGRDRSARRAAGAQRALGARHGLVAAAPAWTRSIPPALRRSSCSADGPTLVGRGDPPRGRRRRGRRGPRQRPLRRPQRPSGRDPARALAAAARTRASRARAPSASPPCSSTAAIFRAPGDADTPADLPLAVSSAPARLLVEVHDHGRRTPPHTTAASALRLGGERDERVGAVLAPFEHGAAALLVERRATAWRCSRSHARTRRPARAAASR